MFIVYLDQSTSSDATPFTNDDNINQGFTDQTQLFGASVPADITTNGANYVNGVDISDGSTTSRPVAYAIHSRVFNSNVSNSATDYYIGRNNVGGATTEDIDGGIAEIILYSTDLSASDREAVESYLSIKYGIPLNSGDRDIVSSNGSVVYTGNSVPAYAAYNTSVSVIGRDDATDFENSLGKSQLGALTINKDGGFNADQQFIAWGNNGLDIDASNTSDLPSGIEARVARVWRTNLTNNPSGTVDLAFDFGYNTSRPQDLRLLIDTDGTFSNATVLSTAPSQNVNVYTFSNIDLSNIPDGAYFTIGSVSFSDSPLPLSWLSFVANEN